MQQITIRTHQPGRQYNSPHFFILNKGNNSGKPSTSPWVNSYVVSHEDPLVLEHYFWLCYSLHSTGSFLRYLKGSVIEFITINDIKKVLRTYEPLFAANPEGLGKLVKVLQNIQTCEAQAKTRLMELKNLKRSALHLFVKSPA